MVHDKATCSCSTCTARRNGTLYSKAVVSTVKVTRLAPQASLKRNTVGEAHLITTDKRHSGLATEVLPRTQRGTRPKMRSRCGCPACRVGQAFKQANIDSWAKHDDRFDPDWSTYIEPTFGKVRHGKAERPEPLGTVYYNGRRIL